jgi:hypothetical protein
MESQSATPPTYVSVQNANQPETPLSSRISDWFFLISVPPSGFEPLFSSMSLGFPELGITCSALK